MTESRKTPRMFKMTDLPEKKTDWSLVEGEIGPETAGHSNVPSTPSLDTPQPTPAHSQTPVTTM